jgi:hypothetical protein
MKSPLLSLVCSGLIALSTALAVTAPTNLAHAEEARSSIQLAQSRGTQYCVTCYGETQDYTSKRTCYEITAPTQIHMRAFGIRQCTALSGNLWYNFAVGSCEGKRYCNKVYKR